MSFQPNSVYILASIPKPIPRAVSVPPVAAVTPARVKAPAVWATTLAHAGVTLNQLVKAQETQYSPAATAAAVPTLLPTCVAMDFISRTEG